MYIWESKEGIIVSRNRLVVTIITLLQCSKILLLRFYQNEQLKQLHKNHHFNVDFNTTDVSMFQTEKKKKDKSGNEEKKPKKSSVKKEKTQEPPKAENVSHDSLDIKKAEVVEPKYVETAVGPDHEPEVQPEPETQTEPETQPDPETQPQPETTQPEPELEPKTEPEAQVEPPEASPELVAEQNEITEEARPQPRRKPSRRNYELEIDEEKLTQLKEVRRLFV